MKINNIPEIIDQTFWGNLQKFLIWIPKYEPKLRKINCKILTKKGNKVRLISVIAPQIPIQKLSKERAIAKNKASCGSMIFELFKSEDIGLLKIFLESFSFFKAWKHMYIPIQISIKHPKKLVNTFGNIYWIRFPKNIDIYVVISDIANKIIFPILDIFVFLIPYVIPIPKESMLLDNAKSNEFIIITPLTT